MVPSLAGVSLKQQLEMEWTRQLQWRFAQARAESALASQRGKAEHALFTAAEQVSQLDEEVYKLTMQHHRKAILTDLDAVLTSQVEALAPVEREMEHFERSYNGLSHEITSVTRMMPLRQVKLNEGELLAALQVTLHTLQGMEAHCREAKHGVRASAEAIQELGGLVHEERSALVQAASLLRNFAASEVEDRSLAVQCMQLRQETERIQATAGRGGATTPLGRAPFQSYACESV